MRQCIGIADVSVNDLHALGCERLVNLRVEVDDADLLGHRRVFAMQLAQQRAGGAEETEQHDPPRLCVAAIRLMRHIVEIAEAETLERTDERARDGIAVRHSEGAEHREDDEGQ